MKHTARISSWSALWTALSVFVVMGLCGVTNAQVAPSGSPPPSAAGTIHRGTLEDLSQAELLKAYLQVQEQLHAMQLAIVSSRAESEAAARAQAAAMSEKLEMLKASLESERDRQRYERQQADAERERQRIEAERTNSTVLWIAGIFGGVGLVAILLMPLLQWRTINRITEITRLVPALPAPDRGGLLPAGLNAGSDQAVAGSNQRLLSAIDRMEQRIFELEHTSAPAAAPAASQTLNVATSGVSFARPTSATNRETKNPMAAQAMPASMTTTDPSGPVALLLGRGRLLLEANKAKEALACYDEILRAEPSNAEALVRKGVALEHLKRDEEALQCYNLAIRADRRKTLAYLCKGAVCSRLGRDVESVESYEQALRTEEAGAF